MLQFVFGRMDVVCDVCCEDGVDVRSERFFQSLRHG